MFLPNDHAQLRTRHADFRHGAYGYFDILRELVGDSGDRKDGFQLRIRRTRYSPVRENKASGDHAAMAGGNWFTSPIFSNSSPIPQ